MTRYRLDEDEGGREGGVEGEGGVSEDAGTLGSTHGTQPMRAPPRTAPPLSISPPLPLLPAPFPPSPPASLTCPGRQRRRWTRAWKNPRGSDARARSHSTPRAPSDHGIWHGCISVKIFCWKSEKPGQGFVVPFLVPLSRLTESRTTLVLEIGRLHGPEWRPMVALSSSRMDR